MKWKVRLIFLFDFGTDISFSVEMMKKSAQKSTEEIEMCRKETEELNHNYIAMACYQSLNRTENFKCMDLLNKVQQQARNCFNREQHFDSENLKQFTYMRIDLISIFWIISIFLTWISNYISYLNTFFGDWDNQVISVISHSFTASSQSLLEALFLPSATNARSLRKSPSQLSPKFSTLSWSTSLQSWWDHPSKSERKRNSRLKSRESSRKWRSRIKLTGK